MKRVLTLGLAAILLLGGELAQAQTKKRRRAVSDEDPGLKRETGSDISRQSTERPADSDAKVEADDDRDGKSSALVAAENLRLAVMTDGRFWAKEIRFVHSQPTIQPESKAELARIADLMKRDPDLTFAIEAHAQGDGDEATNQKLSEDRADAVKARLVALGVDASRLRTKGMGGKKPDGDVPAEGRAHAQRVEFVKQ
jgi:outer membrane protein OmpA-like peptidoglycan-associated protein